MDDKNKKIIAIIIFIAGLVFGGIGIYLVWTNKSKSLGSVLIFISLIIIFVSIFMFFDVRNKSSYQGID